MGLSGLSAPFLYMNFGFKIARNNVEIPDRTVSYPQGKNPRLMHSVAQGVGKIDCPQNGVDSVA